MKTRDILNYCAIVFVVAIVSRAVAQQSILTYDVPGNLTSVIGTNAIAPGITTRPQSTLLYSNNAVTLSVVASGAGLSYQWYSNGVTIVGAISDSLVFANLPSSNYTNFTVVISNVTGVVTSTPAAIWADSNGNGIPDWWEVKYFGNLNQPADGDYDGDGVSNIDEYREGTDPTNPNSYNPRLYNQASANGRIVASPDQPYYTMGQVVMLTAIPDTGQDFLGWSGSVSGSKAEIALVMNSHKTISASFGIPLPVALDNTNLGWTTGGSASWYGQTAVTKDGTNAAQSGLTSASQQSWLQAVTTNLAQNFQLSFWWNVSSQPPDGLTFSVDGNIVASLSGEAVGWQHVVTNLTFGSHTLLWQYAKDGGDVPTGIPFTDAAWLDQVALTPVPTAPVMTNQPVSQYVLPGAGAMFSVLALGSQPLSYQWVFNGSALPGATNTSLLLTNLQTSLSTLFAVVTNAYGAATSTVATLLVATTNCLSPPSGLVSWWSGNGNALDIMGGNNGTLEGEVTYTNGVVGQAFSFDGVSGWIDVTNEAPLNPTGPFSVEYWINANPVQSDSYFEVADHSHGFTDNTGWFMEGTTANGTIGFGFGDGSGFCNLGTASSVLDNKWHHVAGVFTGTQLQVYLDGVLNGTQVQSIPPVSNSRDVEIGSSWGGGTRKRYFNGLVDELHYYNRALSPGEVAAIFDAGSAGMCQPTLSFSLSTNSAKWGTNGFSLQLGGLNGSGLVVIYASTNLISWTPIYTNPPVIGSIQHVDSTATNFPMRFYRAVEQ